MQRKIGRMPDFKLLQKYHIYSLVKLSAVFLRENPYNLILSGFPYWHCLVIYSITATHHWVKLIQWSYFIVHYNLVGFGEWLPFLADTLHRTRHLCQHGEWSIAQLPVDFDYRPFLEDFRITLGTAKNEA